MTTQSKKTKAAPEAAPKQSVAEAKAAVEKATPDADLVVFAFRLTPAERELIHKAAGPAKASRFVRALAVAAAGGDEEAMLKLLGGPAPATE